MSATYAWSKRKSDQVIHHRSPQTLTTDCGQEVSFAFGETERKKYPFVRLCKTCFPPHRKYDAGMGTCANDVTDSECLCSVGKDHY